MENNTYDNSLLYENNTILKQLLQQAKKFGIDISNLESKLDNMDSKLDLVIHRLKNLEMSFSDFKNETRDIEEKIIGMTSQLMRFEETVSSDQIADYYSICENNYMNWERFDSFTQKVLPISEYIFSKLQGIPNYEPDYAPVILELCRALENELFLKIFNSYIQHVIKSKVGNQLELFLQKERGGKFIDENGESKSISIKSGKLLKAIYKASKKEKILLTLGEMHHIINDVNDENIRKSSVIFKDFYLYLNAYTDIVHLFDEDFLYDIDSLIDDYRNPSAHREPVSIEMAKKCKEIMPERLDYLIDCIK